jgi:hypothetical protein
MSLSLYYRIEKSSPVMKTINEVLAAKRIHAKALNAFMRKHSPKRTDGCTEGLMGDGHSVYGIKVERSHKKKPYLQWHEYRAITDCPGWQYSMKQNFNVPNRKTAEGKVITADLRAIPAGTDWSKISGEVFGHGLVMDSAEGRGFCLRYASFALDSKTKIAYVIMHPKVKKASKTWPKGLTEIKGSEIAHLIDG